jgi:predicted RNA binding protein YcfA (HicA-like mRNA interferase family)
MKVRGLLRMIEQDGGSLVATGGGHRQFKHPSKAGQVTVLEDGNTVPQATSVVEYVEGQDAVETSA